MSESHVVNSLDDIFEETPPEIVCTGNHPPCNCAWRRIANALGHTDIKANTIQSAQRRRERERQGHLSFRRQYPPEIESDEPTDMEETIRRIFRMLKNVRIVNHNVMPPPERPKPQDSSRQGKGGIILP